MKKRSETSLLEPPQLFKSTKTEVYLLALPSLT